MAEVPSAPLGAAVNLAAYYDSAADPRADLDKDHAVDALGHAAPVLAEGHYVHLVVDEDRGSVLPGEHVAYGKPVPARPDRGRGEQPGRLLDRTREAEPNRQHVPRIGPLPLQRSE